MRLLHLALPLATVLACASVQARTIYRWVDRQGQGHYTDTPVPGATEIHVPDPVIREDTLAGQADAAPANALEGNGADAAIVAAACKDKKEKLKSYLDADEVVEMDALGKEHLYSSSERIELIKRTRDDIRMLCAKS